MALRKVTDRIGSANGFRLLSNPIGDRGEKMFELAITDFQQFPRPLFKPGFLGEKWPTIDYYVELLGVRNASPFFFAQVKTARTPLRATALTIQATKEKCLRMFRLPGPTYIVGVHEPTRRTFILSLHAKPKQGVYVIPFRHELTPANLQILHKEVASFWRSSPAKPQGSHFV